MKADIFHKLACSDLKHEIKGSVSPIEGVFDILDFLRHFTIRFEKFKITLLQIVNPSAHLLGPCNISNEEKVQEIREYVFLSLT